MRHDIYIYHENRLLADDSHEISYLIFSKIKNLSSAAVIAALRVKRELVHYDVVYSNNVYLIVTIQITTTTISGRNVKHSSLENVSSHIVLVRT